CVLGEIMDAAGDPAVDSADNKFKETAQSLWSDVVDGRATTLGGTGGEMADYEDRIIYTDAKSDGSVPTSGTELDDSGYQIDIDTWDDPATAHIRTAICPTPSTDPASDCADRMLWLLGKIIEPDDDTDTSTTTRWTVNDVLHSSPAVITYGGTDADSDGVIETFFDKIVVGTNDGGMRVINGSTGIEEFEFLPAATLETQRTLFDNPEGTHPYGLDLTPTVRIKDVNGNGRIEPSAGDRVYVYIGMRRGGRNLYAIDMTGSSQVTSTTQRVIPKFLWR